MEIAIAVFDLAKAGGIERDAARVGRALAARGHNVRLISTSSSPLADGIPLTKLRARGLTNHGRMTSFSRDLEAIVDRRKSIVVGFQRLTGLDVLYCGDWRVPTGFLAGLMPRYRALRRLEEACCGPDSHTALLMLSQAQADAYRKAWSIDIGRITVLPPTLDPRRLIPSPTEQERLGLRRSFDIKDHQCAWLWIGLQPKVKGLERVIAALAMSRNARLLIAGVDPGDKRLGRLLERAGLEGYLDRITTLGMVDHDMLDRLFGACDVLVHPARLDVTGTVIVEALGANVPVVTTENCGYAVHVKSSGAGSVLPEHASPAAIAKAAAAAVESRASLTRLAHSYVAASQLTGGIQLAVAKIEEIANLASSKSRIAPQSPSARRVVVPSDGGLAVEQ
ncbi:glycosyltransferase family 4 protein [Mesorhizobium sp. CU2]|uniref:glycosyltransferase family 4 protein n=1 Tax=unclassified Mesorhizobium TaxID=325217 RepID=UPI00112C0033|nr:MULTISPECIES: glycosyltransferase family 4 protein [unclassified Mesorhizobium]TPN81833.1 glycosyltransferase family 4 protein [Mesorhizobium sp. CU3]TPO07104.1 glycosyltransferase family 4 protein [Mesorhizobium sp. CU2]